MVTNSSIIGAAAELAVATKAMQRGYDVAQPFGAYSKYDLIIDVNNVLIKVQVKSLRVQAKNRSGSYLQCPNCRTKRNRNTYEVCKYEPANFDFAACFFLPTNDVFLVPFDVFTSTTGQFTLSNKRQVLYKDAWHLLEEFAALKPNWRLAEDFNPTDVKFDS